MSDLSLMILLLMLVVLILFTGVFVVKKVISATDPNAEKTVLDKDMQAAQDFISIVDIRNDVICLGSYRYRAVLECSSINYMLKTEKEREMIEQSYQRFVNSITFPIVYHIQTRPIDNTEIVRALEEDISRLNMTNNLMRDYANMYLETMKSFDKHIGNAKLKKKYIIIGYEDAGLMQDLTPQEKEEYSLQQLRERIEFVRNQLVSLGIKSERLDNQGLTELLYSSYHREDVQYDMLKAVGLGEFTSPIVKGNIKTVSAEENIDLELVKLQKLIKDEYLDITLGRDSAQYKKMSEIYNGIEQMREIVDRPYGGQLNILPHAQKTDKANKEEVTNRRFEEKKVESKISTYYEDKEEDFSFNFEETKREDKVSSFDINDEEDFSFSFEETKREDKVSSFDINDEEDFSFGFEETKREDKVSSFDFEDEEDFSFSFEKAKKEDKVSSFDFEDEEDFSFSFEETKKEDKVSSFDFEDDFSFGENELDKIFNNEDDDEVVISKRIKTHKNK